MTTTRLPEDVADRLPSESPLEMLVVGKSHIVATEFEAARIDPSVDAAQPDVTLDRLMAREFEIVRPEEALQVLRRALLGGAFTTVMLGDTWSLAFSALWLISHEVRSPSEMPIARALDTCSSAPRPETDSEEIPRAVATLACRRKAVLDLTSGADASLSLRFSDGAVLTFPTDVPIVDWYWALTTAPGTSPYSSYVVSCFSAGEIHVARAAADRSG